MKYILCIIAVMLLMVIPYKGTAQPIIINEVFNSNLSTDEWLELLVVQDSLDLRGWDITDFTSGGGAGGTLVFANNTLWSSVRKGTIIVIGQSGATFTEDTDASDYVVMIKGTNGAYFTGTVFLFAGSSEAVQIRNASQAHVFGVSWGTNNAGSLPDPKVHFSGTSSSNTSITFNSNSVAALTSTANWTINNASTSRGAGNGGLNTTWITALRANTTGDGAGTATVFPDTMKHGQVSNITVTYTRDTAFTITDMRVILPKGFLWSQSSGDVSASDLTATTSVSGDTITFNSLVMSSDSTQITIQNVTAPDTTGFYSITVQTKKVTAFANLSQLPKIVLFGIPLTIAEVKGNDVNGVPIRLGQLATTRGVVTVANQFGGPSYIQDNTGGMALFGSSFSTAVNIGDEVVVTGKVDPFNGLFELTSPHLDTILSSGNEVTPVVVTAYQLSHDGSGGVENYEGRFVRVNGITVRNFAGSTISNWTVSGSGTNYVLVNPLDTADHVDIRVDNNVDFANAPAPAGTFDIVGVLSQFKNSSPYIGGYQLMPRSSADILSQGPIFGSFPVEDNITSTSFDIGWTTLNDGTSRLRYGTTSSYELGLLAPDDVLRTTHSVSVTGLQPATIYHVQAFSVSGSDTSFANDLIVSTSSPAGTTGQINVYFNKSIDATVAIGEAALGNQNLVNLLINRINGARYSIDLALYSLSGATEGSAIATALVNAKNRGVKVRMVCEYDNNTSSAWTTIVSNGIPRIDDKYDAVWAGQGLMHDKFVVFDYRGGAPESVWVWTGSWNPTDQGSNSDRQNAIEIQDVALAGAYTLEFNEMWGSSTDTPNQTTSRFGGRKTNNTPHKFMINGVPVSSYFSPSDQTTQRIAGTLSKAQHSVGVGVLTFTRKDLADTLIGRKNAGKKVRIVMDNNTDTGNQFSYLQTNGVDVLLAGGTGLLHHKYALVDADQTTGPMYVVTGSHNWSNSAENSNDENTLIIQNERVAHLYLQEFSARYNEAGGSDPIVTDVKQVNAVVPEKFELSQNYPNPFNPVTNIRFSLPQQQFVTLKIYDVIGREVATLIQETKQPGTYQVEWNAAAVASGVYFYRLTAGNMISSKKLVLLK